MIISNPGEEHKGRINFFRNKGGFKSAVLFILSHIAQNEWQSIFSHMVGAACFPKGWHHYQLRLSMMSVSFSGEQSNDNIWLSFLEYRFQRSQKDFSIKGVVQCSFHSINMKYDLMQSIISISLV